VKAVDLLADVVDLLRREFSLASEFHIPARPSRRRECVR
jgi:hypothetical protein